MRKYTLDELKALDVTKILPKKLATTKGIESCEDDEDLQRHTNQVEKLLNEQRYPALLKMSSTTGKHDYEIVRCADEILRYCGEYLDCKCGYDVYLDEENKPLIVVYGQSYQDKEKENIMHWSFQCVTMIRRTDLDVDVTELYKYLMEERGY